MWSFPGGGLELGEDLKSSILREIDEETKLTVSNLELFFTHIHTIEDDQVLILSYMARAIELDVHLNWEHDDYVWIKLDDLANYKLTIDAKKIVKQYKFNSLGE